MAMIEGIQSEETARRILQNQRTILEQNAKILAFQETITKEKEGTANSKSVVPATVKVSSNDKKLMNFTTMHQTVHHSLYNQ
jgi:hypothetical protein